MKVVTAQQMREIDRATIQDFGFPGRVLMENAGNAVAQAATELLPPGRCALIFCGKGNNGGDGFVAARHLAAAGFAPQVALLADGDELTGDAAANYKYARVFDLPIHENPSDELIKELLLSAGVVIDAILGTGISGQVQGRSREIIELLASYQGPIIAVDVPSGIDANTGVILGAAIKADVTVTFGLPKQGLYLYPARDYCGQIRIIDISLAPPTINRPQLNTYITTAADVTATLPKRAADAHKGDAGRVLLIAGSAGLTGAATMASMAAARTGAGLVTLAIPAALNPILEAKCTEVMTYPLMDHGCGYLRMRNAKDILRLAQAADAIAIGPGLGREENTFELVRHLVAEIDAPIVLDADGVNAFIGHKEELAASSAELIITPHPGELANLTDLEIAEIQADRVGVAQKWATELNAVMVLKGAATVAAAPDRETWINTTGNSGMASGGMGDILTGMVAALLASGAEGLQAAAAAVWMHGRAADMAAEKIGPRGYLPTDLLDLIPAVFEEIL